jgi:hypothetical protein
VIDTWVVRYPGKKPARGAAPPPAAPAAGKPDEGGMVYELEKARCEGNVVVHQDPTDPAKSRGVDIRGTTLLVDHTPDGSVLTVTGTEAKLAEVHHEDTSILGPKVVIDELHNRVEVEGRGSLKMLAGSDLAGGAPRPQPAPKGADPKGGPAKPPGEVIIHWRDGMDFFGARKQAEFRGKVRATQGESYVVCHTMQVLFDRPVYFNQARRPAAPPPAAPRGPQPGAAAPDPNRPKIDVVYCYPAPGDARDEAKGSDTVTYSEVIRDTTGTITKTQHVTALELVMKAQVLDAAGREPYQQVEADGPGVVRIWQPGEKDATGPAAAPGAAPPPAGRPAPKGGNPPRKAESEMKLTVVQFSGRMTVKDKKIYQEAVFQTEAGGSIEVIHAPAPSPNIQLDAHHLPPGAARLKCTDKLVVSSYRRDPTAPATQRMDAYGNADIRSDEYDGWGETVSSDGRFVTLEGSGNTLARIQNRYKQDQNYGKKIIYDRATGSYRVDGSAGATIQNSPPPPQPMRQP